MTSVLSIGVAGMRAAEMRVAARAQNIVNLHTENYRPAVPVQTSQSAGPVVTVARPVELSGDFPFIDLVSEIVDMNIAKQAYRASAEIVRTAGEMQRTLLDAIA
jgi:flagellar basal body rod protein FlgC